MSQPFVALAPAFLRTIEVDYIPPFTTFISDSSSTDSSSTDSSSTSSSSTDSSSSGPGISGDPVFWNFPGAGGIIEVLVVGATHVGTDWTLPIFSEFGGGSFDSVRIRYYDSMGVQVGSGAFNPAWNAPNIVVHGAGFDHAVLDVLPGSPATTVGSFGGEIHIQFV